MNIGQNNRVNFNITHDILQCIIASAIMNIKNLISIYYLYVDC